MFVIYSLLYSLAFALMLPLFLLRSEKYAAGFWQRLGFLPEFKQDERPVIWLHSVSVGETNAARPLVDALRKDFPRHRLVVSATTKTGQTLATDIFKDKADAVFYFPFDWKFSVRKALNAFQPELVLLMETEIWPRFFREASRTGAKVAIVNGRLSEKSFKRYSCIKGFVRSVLENVDLALMQDEADAGRIKTLGIEVVKVFVTGNLKFDQAISPASNTVTERFRERFGISSDKPLIVGASTHEPEEDLVLDALEITGYPFRVLFAPRHPGRFDAVASRIREWGYSLARRSDAPNESDRTADVILLDSIGELRSVYPFADIVFVGGSLIPHGGQSVLEPAAAGKAIVSGPFTHNFDAVVKEFLERKALIQLPESPQDSQVVERLCEVFTKLIEDEKFRRELGENAAAVLTANSGATAKTVEYLRPYLTGSE